MSDILEKPPDSQLGYSGHFMLSGLTGVAERYGLSIETLDLNRFAVTSTCGALDDLCPASIVHEYGVFDRKNLRAWLQFLHQPVKAGLGKNDQGRSFVHDYLWLAAAGKARPEKIGVDGPCKLHGEGCDGVGCDDHLDMQREMDRAQEWLGKTEIGGKGLIPALSFDPEKGLFTVLLAQELPGEHESLAKLKSHFRETLEKEGVSLGEAGLVYLNADQIKRVIESVAASGLEKQAEDAALEERASNRIQAIGKRKLELESSNALRLLLNDDALHSPQTKLQRLLKASSALKRIMSSDELREAWGRFHFSDRKNPPTQIIAKEFAALEKTLEYYADKDEIDAVTLEAIGHEFYPLLALGKKISEALELNDPLSVIENLNLQDFEISSDHLNPDGKKILELLESFTGNKKSIPGRIFSAGVKASKDFVMDTVHFMRESPALAVVCAGLTAALFISKAQADAAQALYQATHATALAFGDSGMHSVSVNPKDLPAGSFDTRSWHWNIGLLGPYKHYAQDTFVVGTARTILDDARAAVSEVYERIGIIPNLNSHFSIAAEKTVIPVADKLFKANLFQNLSHSVFWLYMVSRGWQHRTQGSQKILNLMAPITDLVFHGALAGKERLATPSSARLQRRFMELVEETRASLPENETNEALAEELLEAASARAALEARLPEDLRETPLIKTKRLKTAFRISHDNFEPTLKALETFDLALAHIASDMGVKYGWHREMLRGKISRLICALKTFQKNEDLGAFQKSVDQHLADVIGAEFRQKGVSSVYKAIFNENAGAAEQSALERDADARYGRLRRADIIKARKERSVQGGLWQRTKSVSTIVGTHVWGQIVSAMRKLEKAYYAVPAGLKKKMVMALICAGGAAALLDMGGLGQALDVNGAQILGALSQGAGNAAATALTLSIFAIYNFFEDVVGLHVFGGGGAYGTGAVSRVALEPLAAGTREKINARYGLDLRREWEKLQRKMPWRKADAHTPEPVF